MSVEGVRRPERAPDEQGKQKKIETVKVQGADGVTATVSCKKKWVVTALKVTLCVVVIGGFAAATVFTFGAAGVLGAGAAAAMGVTVTGSATTAGVLSAAGGVFAASTGALTGLAYKRKLWKYTGKDADDAKKFMVHGANAVIQIACLLYTSPSPRD